MDTEAGASALVRALTAGDEAAFLAAFFARLAEHDADGAGITREAFGPGEDAAFALVRRLGEALGLVAATDAAGNLVLRFAEAPPGEAPVVLGSHLDSVPEGGNFDGAAGIAGALLVAARFRRDGVPPPVPLEVLVLRCEESPWFDRAYVGSLALLGGLTPRDLARRHRRSGETLARCLERAGADVARIEAGDRLRDPASIRAYVEMHIEQGPVMVARGFPVAPVTGIRGNRRYPTNRITGAAGHSGAVPRWLRHDTVFAFADLVSALDGHWEALQERGFDLVVTLGVVHTDPKAGGLTRIPGELTFSLEFRSQSEATLDAFDGLVRAECETIAARRGVAFALDEVVASPPAKLDPGLQNALMEAADALAVSTEPLASGAGHDAAVFAGAGVPSALVFVRNEGGSHNPAETMAVADLLVAVDLVHRALAAPAFGRGPVLA